MSVAIARTVDLRDSEDQCGDTALKAVRRVLKDLGPGDVVEILSDVAEQVFTVRAWARKTGRDVLEETKEGKLTRMLLEQSDG